MICCHSYRDQFMLLAEEIANEKAEKEIRGRAQQQVIIILCSLVQETDLYTYDMFRRYMN